MSAERKKDAIYKIVKYLKEQVEYRPEVGIICGSGLGDLVKYVQDKVTIKYEDIPEFPRATVQGHAGELVFGTLGGKKVVCMRGRFHYYEGWRAEETTIGVRVMCALGIKLLFVTNAAGGCNEEYKVGDVMCMKDHINFPGMAGAHPLKGPNDSRFGDRFPPMTYAYDESLRQQLVRTAQEIKFQCTLHEGGTYCALSGPSYETPQEIHLVRVVGGDCVGMSTAAEVTVAAHCGVKCVGMSMITNECRGPGDDRPAPFHEEVIEVVNQKAEHLQELVEAFIERVDLRQEADSKGYTYFSNVLGNNLQAKARASKGTAIRILASVTGFFLAFAALKRK
jgi:purine-nucleoside phosphorylase